MPQDLLTLDARGKRLVSQWLKEMSAHLAVAVKHIGMIVDPDAILVGGRLPIRMIDELLRYVHEHLTAGDATLPSLHSCLARRRMLRRSVLRRYRWRPR